MKMALPFWGIVLLAWSIVPPAWSQVKYVHTDALGSVVAMTNASGAVVETTREYEPYGQQLTPAIQDGPGYTGHLQDAATGLTYMQQRYYDPGIGRFLSVDPVTANANTGAGFNRYSYAINNPYRFTDPDGRCEAPLGTRIKPAGCERGRSIDYGTPRQSGATTARLSSLATSSSSQISPPGDGNGSNQATASAVKTIADAGGMIAGAKQNSLSAGGMWRGANGRMYDLGWGGNQHTGARSLVLQEANAFKVAGQGLFLLSSGISLYEGAGALQRGDGFGAAKAGVDIGWGAAATFGGPVGLVGGATYIGTSFLVTIPSVRQYTVEPATDAMCLASGNC